MKNAVALLLALTMSTVISAKEPKQTPEEIALGLTPDVFEKSVTTHDDDMEVSARLTTEDSFQPNQDPINGNDIFFRAFINKTTGKVTYQVYEWIKYRGDWRNYDQVNYQSSAGLSAKPLTVISRDVLGCSPYGYCDHQEDFAFELTEDEMKWIAARPLGQIAGFWRVRYKAQSGPDLDMSMTPAEASGFLAAIADYKRDHKVP
jgi:hypothetical protein